MREKVQLKRTAKLMDKGVDSDMSSAGVKYERRTERGTTGKLAMWVGGEGGRQAGD